MPSVYTPKYRETSPADRMTRQQLCASPTEDCRVVTGEELAFLKAMDQYKRRHHRPFPTWREVLDVVRALGYRCVAEPALHTVGLGHAKEAGGAEIPELRETGINSGTRGEDARAADAAADRS